MAAWQRLRRAVRRPLCRAAVGMSEASQGKQQMASQPASKRHPQQE